MDVPESWMDDAVCTSIDPCIFFSVNYGEQRVAKKFCETCPVKNDCLAYALKHNIEFGIWGGSSRRDRLKIKKNKKDA